MSNERTQDFIFKEGLPKRKDSVSDLLSSPYFRDKRVKRGIKVIQSNHPTRACTHVESQSAVSASDCSSIKLCSSLRAVVSYQPSFFFRSSTAFLPSFSTDFLAWFSASFLA